MIIRDAVHGDLTFSTDEQKILDAPEVQRMRGIKQLGASNLIYPSATHTRFEHSLGTVYCAQKILDALGNTHQLDPELIKLIRVSALLHDISHIPFGHTFEDERKLMKRHDKGDRFQLLTTDTKLGDQLDKMKIRDEITAIVEDKEHVNIPKWAKQIVSSTIDADLLDYLRRDNYFTGLSQNYDERIFHSFIIKDNELGINMVKRGINRQDTLTEVMNLLRLRYFLTERVYFHHTKVIAGSMISKALEYILEQGIDEEEFMKHSDGSFLEMISEKSKKSEKLIRAFKERDLFKRSYVLSYQHCPEGLPERLIKQYAADIKSRNAAENKIAELAGISSENVIIYCSGLPSNKEAEVKVNSAEGWHPFSGINSQKTIQEIAILDTKFKHLWKLYILAQKPFIQQVAKASAEYFQIPNELSLI